MPHRSSALSALALLLAIGCGDATSPPAPLAIAPDTARLAWGDTLRLRAAGADPGAPIAWSSSDPTVIRVDSTGLAVALRGGAARVTARAGERSGTREIGVDARFRALGAGFDATCGVIPAGRLLCWGRIVDSTGPSRVRAWRVSPEAVPSLGDVVVSGVEVARARPFSSFAPGVLTCALRPGASPLCWGQSAQGEQGNGTTLLPSIQPPTPIGASATLTSLSIGWSHACGLTADGTAYCWGSASASRLGHASTNATCVGGGSRGTPCQTVPAPVSAGSPYRQIAAGGQHSCGITRSDRLLCWGLGAPAGMAQFYEEQRVPTPLGGDAYASVAAGYDHACAITTDGELRCWGAARSTRCATRCRRRSPSHRPAAA